MSMLSKLAFWKKNDEFNFDDPSLNNNMDLGADPMANPNMTDPSQPPDHLGLNVNVGMPDEFSDSASSPIGLREKAQMKSYEAQQQFQNQSSPAQPVSGNKDFELISSKLDTIKAELDSMNQRLQRIEKIAEKEAEQERKATW